MSDARLIGAWFRRVWRGSPLALGLILVMSFGSAALLTIMPWLWQFVIDEVRGSADPVRIRELAFWMAVVGVGHTVLYLLLQSIRSVMNARIQWRARAIVFAHLAELTPAFHRAWRPGDLVTRMYDDAGEKIAWFMCSGIFRAYEAALIVLVCVGAMVWIDPWLTALVVVPLPLLVVGQAFTQGMLGRRYRAVQEAISDINDELTTTFGGIRIVQSCGLQPTARRRFVAAADRQRAAEVRTAVVQQAVFMMYGYGWQLALVALLLAGGHGVLAERITLGQYVTFEGFVMTLIWPMFDVGMFVSRFKQAGVALTRLQVLMDESHAAPPGAGDPADASIALEGVSVDADDGVPLLDGLTLQLDPGRTLAVVGEVGAGKSVLMQLLGGARSPREGVVRFGGVEAGNRTEEAQRRVAWVPQDPVLISAPLRDNILLGREVAEADLLHALEVSRLAQDLPALPDGLDTAVGERGVTLSGGQQQRVALARALVARPQILLLDDATAALDADTEAAFWEQVERALPEVTAVVVTHRVATIQRADAVLVLEGGRAVQAGRHAELLENAGAYRRIYGRLQAEERVGVGA